MSVDSKVCGGVCCPQFGPVIEEGNKDVVHHMELFHCEYPPDVIVPKYQVSVWVWL